MKTVLQIIAALGLYKVGSFFYYRHHKRVDVEEIRLGKRLILFKDYQGKFVRSHSLFEKLLEDCSPFIKVNNQVKIVYDDPEITSDPEQQMYIVGLEIENEEQKKSAMQILKKSKGYQLVELPECDTIVCKETTEHIEDLPTKFNEFVQDIMIPAFFSILRSKNLDDKGQFLEKQIFDSEGNMQEVEVDYPIQFHIDRYINHPLIVAKLKRQEEERKKQQELRIKQEKQQKLEEEKKQKELAKQKKK